MKAYLNRIDQACAVRTAALDVLQGDFGEEAARKWLQRHRPEEAVTLGHAVSDRRPATVCSPLGEPAAIGLFQRPPRRSVASVVDRDREESRREADLASSEKPMGSEWTSETKTEKNPLTSRDGGI